MCDSNVINRILYTFHNIQSHFWTVQLLCAMRLNQAYIIVHSFNDSWLLMFKCTVEQSNSLIKTAQQSSYYSVHSPH